MKKQFSSFEKARIQNFPSFEIPKSSNPPPITELMVVTLEDSKYLKKYTTPVLGDDISKNLENTEKEKKSFTVDYNTILKSYKTIGFQAIHFDNAVSIINEMINWRLSMDPIPVKDKKECLEDYKTTPKELFIMENRKKVTCKIFLSYTSNLVASGLRETIKFLVKNKFVECLITTAGGVEEDLLKCFGDFYIFKKNTKDEKLTKEDIMELRKRKVRKVGNVLIPHENEVKFKKWLLPILDEMLIEQKEKGTVWTPSLFIRRMGEKINDESSITFWARKNNIGVYAPGITDGLIGDVLYEHSNTNPGLLIDQVRDVPFDEATVAYYSKRKTGIIALGGGTSKHHNLNTNALIDGAAFCVYVNTGISYNGSDSGAPCDEAVTWGKIRVKSKMIKLYSEATLVFPLLVAQTFAKKYQETLKDVKNN